MSAGGQRQEVRFLAIAIGALVVAVALFVGVRALSSKPPSAAPNKKQNPAPANNQTQKTAKPEPLAPSNRDPFVSVGAKEVTVTNRRSTNPDPRRDPRATSDDPRRSSGGDSGSDPDTAGVRLAGIMRGASAMALIHIGDQRYYAQLGDRVGEFTLVQIGSNSVVLASGGRRLTLTIQPEPGGTTRTRTRRR